MFLIDAYCDNNFEIPEMDEVVAEGAFSVAENILQVIYCGVRVFQGSRPAIIKC